MTIILILLEILLVSVTIIRQKSLESRRLMTNCIAAITGWQRSKQYDASAKTVI